MNSSLLYIVDDDPVFSTIFDKLLRVNHYERILQFSSGEECLNKLAQSNDLPAIIFLDFSMKGLDGLEVLKRIRSDYKDIKVAIITSLDDHKLRDRCIEEGAFMYINKWDIAARIPSFDNNQLSKPKIFFDFNNLPLN